MYDEDLAARLLATFLDELDEQLRVLSSDLLLLETQPGDEERLRSVFRIFHTLKGAARAADVPLIESVSHRLEGLLASARDGRAPLTPVQLDLLFRVTAAFEDAGRRIRARTDLADSPLNMLDRQLRGMGTPGTRASAPTPESVPARPAPTAPEPPATEEIVPIVTEPAVPSAQSESDEQVRVGVYRIDAMIDAASEVVNLAGSINDRQREASALQMSLARGRTAWRLLVQRRLESRLDAEGRAALRAALDTLDEEVRVVTREGAQLARSLARDADRLVTTAGPLLREARDLRLRPVSDITTPLQRTVRELSRTLDKPVQLQVEGENVDADRTVLDRLREPLLHLIRNAIDHGIEPAAERARRNKPAEGTITITAAAAGDRLTITIADDGAGLDLGAIRAQLAERGRAAPDDPASLASALFEGGFSTRAAATEISGRGVGLDVVRSRVEALGGTVDVRWVEHGGTAFTLGVPLTLASLRVVLVTVGDQVLAIPTVSVARLRPLGANDVREIDGRSFLIDSNTSEGATAEAPVPIASLAALLGPPLAERGGEGARRVVQLVGKSAQLAVVVDELLDEREVIVRPLEHLGGTSLFSGGALLPTGDIAFVVNVPAVVAAATGRPQLGALQTPAARRTRDVRRARVMVVDDSITTRTLEESVLRAAGYDVTTATDGADAWRLLQANPTDLVISDIEMPRMDGIALCEAIRALPALSTIPIILVTSLDRPEQVQRGLAAGADAYLPKSSFDQDTLLDIIHQLLGDSK